MGIRRFPISVASRCAIAARVVISGCLLDGGMAVAAEPNVEPIALQSERTSASNAARLNLIEEIVVTGSRLGATIDQATQELQSYSAEALARGGQTTVGDFLNTLSVMPLRVDGSSLQVASEATSVRLHGLPLGSTLVLIDGQRVGISGSAASSNVFDLNNIPLAAVERVDILPQGGSAVYGADAIAGTVNISLKKDFDGFAASARYGGADSTHAIDANVAWGRHWTRAGLSVIGSYLEQSELQGKNRALPADGNYTKYGARDARFTIGNPGNIFSTNGQNLPGLNAPYAAVPAGFTGTPSIAEFAGTAGQLNTYSLLTEYGLIPKTRRWGLLATGSLELTSSTELLLRLLYSHNDTVADFYPNGLLIGTPTSPTYTVSPANPFNPFGVRVGIGYFFPGVQTGSYGTDFYLPSIAVKGGLGDRWNWEIDGWASLDHESADGGGLVNAAATQAALDSSNPATALNPFVAGSPGSPQLVSSVLADQRNRYSGQLLSASALLRGSPFALPAGDFTVALGSEFGHARLRGVQLASGASALSLNAPTVGRDSYALYSEARIPVLEGVVGAAGDLFAITAAGRYDHFSDFGGKWTAQVGAVSHPFAGLTIRGNWGQAFKTPSLYQLNRTQVQFQNPIVDPLSGKPVVVTVISGGNPNLKPETGNSYSVGFTYADGAVPGLQLSLSNWSIQENNSIQALNAQTIANNAASFPGAVLRTSTCAPGPPCPIVSVNQAYANFGEIDVAGVDYDVSYRFPAGGLTWKPEISATQTYRYSVAFQPGQAATSRVSKANDDLNWAPRWKVNLALAASMSDWSGALAARYTGRYQDYDPLLNGTYLRLGGLWYVDANLKYDLRKLAQWSRDVTVEIGAINMLNRQPQFSNARSGAYGYDILQTDIRGRFVYGRIGVGF